MAMTEDLSVFFSTAEFATAATLGGVAVTGIFDNGYSAGNVGGMGIASTQPTLTLPTASVPANPVGLAAVVASVTYTIAEHQPDGTGVSMLYLERTS
jgi:hypothetical protein